MTSKATKVEVQKCIRQAMQLLRHLNTSGNTAISCSNNRTQIVLSSAYNNVSLSRGILPIDIAQLLIKCGYIQITEQKAYLLTDAGHLMLSKYGEKSGSIDPVLRKHVQSIATTEIPTSNIRIPIRTEMAKPIHPKTPIKTAKECTLRETTLINGDETVTVLVNEAESPLSWLYKRRDRNGEPFIDNACYEAGERLRQDVTMAQIMPHVTANWSSAESGGSTGSPSLPTDAMVAARQRLHRAMNAVDGNYAGILLDICGFLKGIEEVERERHWPPRSGKVVLKLALQRLAMHYGLACEAQGPSHSLGIRNWAAL